MSKRVYKRKPLYPSKSLNKGKFDASHDIITFMPKDTRNIFPPRWRTKCIAQAYGSTTSGAGSGDYVFSFNLNNPVQPFNFTNTGLTLQGITKTTYMPAGLTTIFNPSIYQFGRCYASSIELEIIPQSVQDTVQAVITPNYNTPNPANVASALAQPYGKQQVFSSDRPSGNSRNPNVLKHYFTVAKLLGCTQRAVQDDIAQTITFTVASGPVYTAPNFAMNWICNIETMDNTALNQSLELRVKVTYYIELWGNASGVQPIV